MKRAIGLIILLGLAPLAQGAVGELKAVSVSPGQALEQASLQARSKDFAKAGGGDGLVSKHAMVATLRGGGTVIKAALDSKSPTGEVPNLIRLDLSGKGKFKGCPAVALTLPAGGTSATARRIGPATIRVQRDGRTIPLQVRGYYYKSGNYRQLYMQFGTALEGSCAFGAKVRRVRIIDGDGNFRCGDPLKLKVKDAKTGEIAMGDTLQVLRGDKGASVEQRVFFGQRVKVDGKWYDVKISPDGSKVSAAVAKVQMGQVRIPRERWSATLVGTKHLLKLSGGTKPVEAPASQYVFMAYGELHKDGARLRCAGGRAPRGARKVFTVSAGKVTDLAAGSPLTAGLDVMSGGGQTIFSLMLFDASGATVADLAIAGGKRPDAPQIEVHDAASKKIYDGKMRYG